jgi:hypothetical protein
MRGIVTSAARDKFANGRNAGRFGRAIVKNRDCYLVRVHNFPF